MQCLLHQQPKVRVLETLSSLRNPISELAQTIRSWKTTFAQMLQGCLAFQWLCFLGMSLCAPVHPQAARPCLPQQGRGPNDPQLCRDPSARSGFRCDPAPRWCQCWKLGRELSSPLFSVTPHMLINDEVLLPALLRRHGYAKILPTGHDKDLARRYSE